MQSSQSSRQFLNEFTLYSNEQYILVLSDTSQLAAKGSLKNKEE